MSGAVRWAEAESADWNASENYVSDLIFLAEKIDLAPENWLAKASRR